MELEPAVSPPGGTRAAIASALEEVAWLAAIFVAAILAARGAESAGRSPEATALLAFHGGLLAYAALRERAKLALWFRPTRAAVVWGIGAGVAMTATGAAYGTLLTAAGVELPDVAGMLRGILRNPAFLVAWGALFVPVAEEVYFRGRLIDLVRPHTGLRAAVGVSAIAFALVHGMPVFIPAYLAFAWILWKARERTGGLLAPAIAHAINNLVGLLSPSP